MEGIDTYTQISVTFQVFRSLTVMKWLEGN